MADEKPFFQKESFTKEIIFLNLNEICEWIDKIDTSFDVLRWMFPEEHSV